MILKNQCLVNGCQNTFPHEEIRKIGCFFLTLCAWVNIAFEKEFTNELIIKKWEELKKKTFIDWRGVKRTYIENLNLMHPAVIFNELAELPGYFKDNQITEKVPTTVCFPVFYDGNPTHFALGGHDEKGGCKIIFDSWSPSAEARGKKVTHYRQFI